MLLFENIKSAVRLGLGVLGGVLINKGIATPEAVESIASGTAEIVGGALSVGLSFLWSWARNSKIGKYL